MPQPEAGQGSVRVTVPVYGEPAGPTGMVKVCVVTMLPGVVAASDTVRKTSSAASLEKRRTKAKSQKGRQLDLPEGGPVPEAVSGGTGYPVAEKAVVTDSG